MGITDGVLDSLSGIGSAIFNEIFFAFIPQPPPTPEEQLLAKMRKQAQMLCSQQEQSTYQAGVIEKQSRAIRERDEQLERQTKEIQRLNSIIRSQELQLQEQSSRNKHWR